VARDLLMRIPVMVEPMIVGDADVVDAALSPRPG
jgi:hypothetical protein